MIERQGCDLSVREQCRLLSVPRSTLYYEAGGPKASDLAVMDWIDAQYTRRPFYEVERMTVSLHRAGPRIGHNGVRRLMRVMGLEAVYPKLSLSLPDRAEHRVYPYLLRDPAIVHLNQVWAEDISVPQQAALEMGEGLPPPACRSRWQTTVNGFS